MKPDPKRQKDKQRLDRKKAEGKAARDARKAARAEAEDPTLSEEWAELSRVVRRTHGDRRRHAFASMLKLHRKKAIEFMRELIKEYDDGDNRGSFAELLAHHDGEHAVEPIIDGRYGRFVIAQQMPTLLGEAARLLRERLRSPSARVTVPLVEQWLERYGPLTAQDPSLSSHIQSQLIASVLAFAVRQWPIAVALRDHAIDAALDTKPMMAWGYHTGLEGTPVHTILALATKNGAYVGDQSVSALLSWLKTLSPAERARRLRHTKLPETIFHVPEPQRAPLLRAFALDGGSSSYDERAQRGAALSALAHIDKAQAAQIALTMIEVYPPVTFATVYQEVSDEEIVAAALPHLGDRAVRDYLAFWPAAKSEALLDEVLSWREHDPIAVGRYLVLNEAPHAIDMLLEFIGGEHTDNAFSLVLGALMKDIRHARGAREMGTLSSTIAGLQNDVVDGATAAAIVRALIARDDDALRPHHDQLEQFAERCEGE